MTSNLQSSGWTPRQAGEATPREWRFTDDARRAWNAWTDLEPVPGREGEYRLSIRLERAGR